MPKHKLTYWPAIGEGYLARITGSGPTQSVVAGNLIFFSATDNVNGNELWKSDGTAAGTVMVKDIWPGGNSGLSNSSLKELVVAGNNVFFGHMMELMDGNYGGVMAPLEEPLCSRIFG